MACARSGGREHPVFGLWPVHLRHDLRRAMLEEQIRKVDVWTARYRLAIADFDTDPIDPFFNTNRPDDLAEAERLLTGRAADWYGCHRPAAYLAPASFFGRASGWWSLMTRFSRSPTTWV